MYAPSLKYVFTVIFLFLSFVIYTQKLTYDIYLFGSRIGQTVVERTVKNDSTTRYVMNSESDAHLLFTERSVQLHYDITFVNGKYFSSQCKNTRNGEAHYTTIMREGNRYLVKRDNETFYLDGLIDCATVNLFYNEPCSTDKVLSERLGEFRQFKKIGNGLYEAEMSEGITYFYRYINGKLAELEMRKGFLGSIYLRLKK